MKLVETERSACETQVSIVIPTHNEGEDSSLLLGKTEVVREHSIQAEILIVDDNSPDGTGKVAYALAPQVLFRAQVLDYVNRLPPSNLSKHLTLYSINFLISSFFHSSRFMLRN